MASALAQQGLLNPLTGKPVAAGSSLIRELGLLNPIAQRPVASAPARGQTLGMSTASPYAAPAAPSINFDSILQKFNTLANQSIAPIASQIEGQIGQIRDRTNQERSRLESGREPLRQRYEALIADIKAKGTESENAQTRITSGEMAKRGISGESTLAQQEIENAVSPLRGATQRNLQVTGTQREQDLLGLEGLIGSLMGQEQQAVSGLQGGLANIRSSAMNNAFTNALPFLLNPLQQAQLKAYQSSGAQNQAAQTPIESFWS